MTIFSWKNMIYGAFFAAIFSCVLAFGSSVVAMRVDPEWAARFVCEGRVEWIAFKQAWFCVTGPNEFVNIKDAMFWAVFRRALVIAIPVAFLGTFGTMQIMVLAYRRREAMGF